MLDDANTVPLEGWQRTRLIGGCVPFVFFLVVAVLLMTSFKDLFAQVPPVALYLFIGLVLLFTGFQALQRARDLASGIALVDDDVLERSWRSGNRGNAMYFGRFARLGRLRVMRNAHFQSQNGQRYRVVYSPVSRIVWELEPLN